MPASYPTPDDQKVTRHAPKFEWTHLPAGGRQGRPPKLPNVRVWSTETKRFWKSLWSSPQSTQWDQTGESALPMAILWQDAQDCDPSKTAGILGEMRQHQDRHGLNPKAMLQLRWLVVDDEGNAKSQGPGKTPSQARRDRLKIVS